MSVTSEEILSVAAREIGYHADANGHNKYGEWFGLDCVPYCMEFVQWCYHEAGMDLPYKTASCGELLNWYKRNQPECITTDPIPGTIVIFDFPGTKYSTDHTGLFVKCDGYKITTIDGNTSNGSDSNGGWVQQRRRTLGYANPTFIRPRGLVLLDWDKAIAEMTDDQALALQKRINAAQAKLPPSKYAEEACRKAIKSGLFTDGDGNGSLDKPRCALTREEFATVLDREGALDKGERKR